jgi:phage-related protein
MRTADKPLRWMVGTLCTPPVGRNARIEAGVLLRRLQRGEALSMPFSRPMPRIGRSVHELRVVDRETRRTWRLVYRIDPDAILIVHWFEKTTQETPEHIMDLCARRLARYDRG